MRRCDLCGRELIRHYAGAPAVTFWACVDCPAVLVAVPS